MPGNTHRALVCGLLLAHGNAYAGGITITEVSAKGLGTAFASGGAAAEDASSQWFNPASMTRLPGSLAVTASYVAPRFEFHDRGSVQQVGSTSLPLLPGADPQGDGGEGRVVPAAFFTRPLGDTWHVGLAVNAPFGLTTDYGTNWRGRYQAVHSEVTNVNVNPSVAWSASEHWSLGAGFSVNYVEAELTNAVDFAAVCATAVGGFCPNGAVPGQGQFDGFVRNEGDDVSYGYNLGVLWHRDGTRVGLAYRSEIEHDLEGDIDYTTPDALGGFDALGPALGGALSARFSDAGITAPLTLPNSASLSVAQDFERWSVLLDVTWFDWSDLSEVRIQPDNPGAEALVESLGWTDTVRVAAGIVARPTPRWTVRAGAAWDESPVPSAELRSPRVPDSDRIWAAVGASYALTDRWSLDVGYAHLFVDDTPIRRGGPTGDLLLGTYESSADIVSVELSLLL